MAPKRGVKKVEAEAKKSPKPKPKVKKTIEKKTPKTPKTPKAKPAKAKAMKKMDLKPPPEPKPKQKRTPKPKPLLPGQKSMAACVGTGGGALPLLDAQTEQERTEEQLLNADPQDGGQSGAVQWCRIDCRTLHCRL